MFIHCHTFYIEKKIVLRVSLHKVSDTEMYVCELKWARPKKAGFTDDLAMVVQV